MFEQPLKFHARDFLSSSAAAAFVYFMQQDPRLITLIDLLTMNNEHIIRATDRIAPLPVTPNNDESHFFYF